MRKVESRILVNTSAANVILAFTRHDLLTRWWKVERSFIEPRVGGSYTLVWGVSSDGFKYIMTGIITDYSEDSLLHIGNFTYLTPERSILGQMSLIVKATRVNSKTELYLCQDGYQSGSDWDWYYNAVKTAWPVVLEDLKNFLELEKI